MTREEMEERIRCFMSEDTTFLHDVLDVANRYAEDERSEAYSLGWDDGWDIGFGAHVPRWS